MAYDITGKIGDLFSASRKPEWPMYSFERPAYTLWNAIAGRLKAAGWSDDQIKEWLQSKSPRRALDNELGEKLHSLGVEYADNVLKWFATSELTNKKGNQ